MRSVCCQLAVYLLQKMSDHSRQPIQHMWEEDTNEQTTLIVTAIEMAVSVKEYSVTVCAAPHGWGRAAVGRQVQEKCKARTRRGV